MDIRPRLLGFHESAEAKKCSIKSLLEDKYSPPPMSLGICQIKTTENLI
jgi:hypothetical protein